jgi:hypothetical protein
MVDIMGNDFFHISQLDHIGEYDTYQPLDHWGILTILDIISQKTSTASTSPRRPVRLGPVERQPVRAERHAVHRAHTDGLAQQIFRRAW